MDTDVRYLAYTSPSKLSISEFCQKFQLDIENDPRNKFFWNFHSNNIIVVDDVFLTYLGYKGLYNRKKVGFFKLLKKNPQINYTEVADTKDVRKKHIVLDIIDMETLMTQMRTEKCVEIRKLLSSFKDLKTKYSEYEQHRAIHLTELLTQQNYSLLTTVDALKISYEEGRRLAEEERIIAERRHEETLKIADEAERRNAEAERRHKEAERRHEEERKLAEEERKLAAERHSQLSSQLEKNTFILRTDIGPNLAPIPISKNKCRNLGN